MDVQDLVTRFFAALNAADWSELATLLDEDVALDTAGGARTVGREAFCEALAPQALEGGIGAEDLVVLTAGDGLHAAAEFTLRTGGHAAPAGLFFEIENGAIVRVSARAGLPAM